MPDVKRLSEDPMSLLHAGYEALESLDFDRAAALGRQVADRGRTAGFELIALARMSQGRGDEAVQALEQAEASDPSNWGILNRLGSICSDLGRYVRAEETFRRALGIPGADGSAIRTNLAILCGRMGRYDDALAWCDSVVADSWRLAVRDVRVGVLASAQRWPEALAATDGIAEELEEAAEPATHRDPVARVCAARARALWNASGDREGAVACARIALALSPTCPEALEALREARALRSDQARMFHVIARGRWHEALEPGGVVPGFLRTYHVIADDANEAIRLAFEMEREELAGSLEAGKVRDDGPAEPGCKGVTSCSGYMFQPG